jgi:MSHA biogenesis protein MshK
MKRLNRHQYLLQLSQYLAIVIGIVTMLYMPTSLAQTLKDPTQPPAILSSVAATDNTVPAGPVLQSVMIGPQTQAAIINGEKVFLGKKYQSATLIKVSEGKVILRNPDMSTQTLLMDYAIDKKMVSPEIILTTPKIKNTSKPITQDGTKPIEISEK